MQAAASVPPLHLSPLARDKYRLSLRELRLLEFRLCQVSRLQEGRLERLNQDLVLFQVRLGIRRKILPPILNPMSRQCRHPVCSSAIRTADLVRRLALAAGSDHAPRET